MWNFFCVTITVLPAAVLTLTVTHHVFIYFLTALIGANVDGFACEINEEKPFKDMLTTMSHSKQQKYQRAAFLFLISVLVYAVLHVIPPVFLH